MIEHAPDIPWMPERSRSCVRGRVLLKVASGEAPEAVPCYLDADHRNIPLRFDGGPVDAAIQRFSPVMRVTRAHRPAQGFGSTNPISRWDDVEEETGLSRTFRIDVDPDTSLLSLLEELRSLAKVEMASPYYLCSTPFAEPLVKPAGRPPADRLYAHRMVGLDQALAFEPGDSTLIVGVVDSGIDLSHQEFEGRIRPGIDTVDLRRPDVSRGIHLMGDIVNPDRIPRDEMGHGTACASIIGALGLKVPRGMAGAAQLLPGRALASARMAERAKPTAIGALPEIDLAVKTLIDLGARVLNLSFGTPESALRDEDYQPHAEIVAYARQRGCILIAASGNDSRYMRYFPAALPGVIAVGSVDETMRPSDFTTRGSHVALCAPGEHIPSAAIGGYQTNTGTSFAAPFVTGACALLLARAARYSTPLDCEEIRTFLTANARPFAAGADSRGCGAGILDVPAALRSLEQTLAQGQQPWVPVQPLVHAETQGLNNTNHSIIPNTSTRGQELFNYASMQGGQVP